MLIVGDRNLIYVHEMFKQWSGNAKKNNIASQTKYKSKAKVKVTFILFMIFKLLLCASKHQAHTHITSYTPSLLYLFIAYCLLSNGILLAVFRWISFDDWQ